MSSMVLNPRKMWIKGNKCILPVFFVIAFSCTTSNIKKQILNPDLPGHVSLGAIGINKTGLFKNNFNEVAVPNLTGEVKLNLSKEKNSIHHYKNLSRKRIMGDSLETLDSVKSFISLRLRLADEIEYIKSINSNEDLKKFLINTNESVVVNEINISMPPQIAAQLLDAEQIYLQNDSKSAYILLTYSKKEGYERISFKEAVILDFKVAKICWFQNYRQEIEALALTKKNKSCPGNTQKNSKKFDEDEEFDKYY